MPVAQQQDLGYGRAGPVGVASLQTEFQADYGIIFAGATLVASPILIFFLLFRCSFPERVRMGAVKG